MQPPRPSALVDNTLLDLQSSSYPTQPSFYSLIAKYIIYFYSHFSSIRLLLFCYIFTNTLLHEILVTL